jgi:glycosyltransferase involved in cell wall biosynthesis
VATRTAGGGREVASSRPRIAVVAYYCGPEEGSEPGTGWEWARMLASIGDVTLITRDEEPRATRTDERIVALGLEPHIRHVTVPYPRWWVGPLRRFERLSYVAWQLGMAGQVRTLGHRFELAWHVTMANVWLGSTAYQLAPRFILGPVGGGVSTPWGVATALGPAGFLFEMQRTAARTLGRWVNPLARAAWGRASLILAQNPETVSWLPAGVRARTVVFPHVVLDIPTRGDRPRAARQSGPAAGRQAMTVGRLLPWKGIALAIRAMTYLPDWRAARGRSPRVGISSTT